MAAFLESRKTCVRWFMACGLWGAFRWGLYASLMWKDQKGQIGEGRSGITRERGGGEESKGTKGKKLTKGRSWLTKAMRADVKAEAKL